MAGQAGTAGLNIVSYNEAVADALDGKVGYFVQIDASETNNAVELSGGDEKLAIGVIVGKLQDGTGSKEPVSVALIDSGGIARVKAGGTITRGDGVQIDTDGEALTATLGTNDAVGIALDSAVDQDLFRVQLGRQPA